MPQADSVLEKRDDMKTKFLLFLLLVFPIIGNAAVVSRPSKMYPSQAIENYEWINKFSRFKVYVHVTDDTKIFLNEEALLRYFKLKMRNFVRDVKIIESDEDFNDNYLYLTVELNQYNDKSSIYTGLISLEMDSAVSWKGASRKYQITKSIAGSKTQITQFIKNDIDQFVEVFAEDFFYLEDILKERNKAKKES